MTVQIERLEKLVQESQQGLGSVNSHLNSLREAADTLRGELAQTKLHLSESKNKCTALQVTSSFFCFAALVRIALFLYSASAKYNKCVCVSMYLSIYRIYIAPLQSIYLSIYL